MCLTLFVTPHNSETRETTWLNLSSLSMHKSLIRITLVVYLSPFRVFFVGLAVLADVRNHVDHHSLPVFRVVGEVEVDVALEMMKREVVCTLLLLLPFKSQPQSADNHLLSLFLLYLTTSFLKRVNLLITNGKILNGAEK
uniref:CBS domain-containing protein n=1 Tax=Caenorhabditis tropicalis TaxID=1561998 RepID=A0A1I7TFL3_9PELO